MLGGCFALWNCEYLMPAVLLLPFSFGLKRVLNKAGCALWIDFEAGKCPVCALDGELMVGEDMASNGRSLRFGAIVGW